ncbi:MAG: hypothetical protein GEV10_09960 [Streptosporangiales bacterium]|nr:hypothetical protein [Streptosporangiales bacterium]
MPRGSGTPATTSASSEPPIRSGWEASGVGDHPRRPASLTLSDRRRRHILDGDPDSTSGGHRYGTGRPGKTEFPQAWSDETIVQRVLSVAQSPDETPRLQNNGKWYTHGLHDGVDVVAVVHRRDGIVTGYPLPGGRGVRQNPEE